MIFSKQFFKLPIQMLQVKSAAPIDHVDHGCFRILCGDVSAKCAHPILELKQVISFCVRHGQLGKVPACQTVSKRTYVRDPSGERV
jgi:hypothetical protein